MKNLFNQIKRGLSVVMIFSLLGLSFTSLLFEKPTAYADDDSGFTVIETNANQVATGGTTGVASQTQFNIFTNPQEGDIVRVAGCLINLIDNSEWSDDDNCLDGEATINVYWFEGGQDLLAEAFADITYSGYDWSFTGEKSFILTYNRTPAISGVPGLNYIAWEFFMDTNIITLGVAPINGTPAETQTVEFRVSQELVGKTYRATINGINYDYEAIGGDTVDIIAQKLSTLMSANTDVICFLEYNYIFCDAKVAGTAFTYNATVIDGVVDAPTPQNQGAGGGSSSPIIRSSTPKDTSTPVITLTPTIDTQTDLFNPSIDSTLCFTPNNKKIVDQKNSVSDNFKKAHQLLLNFDLTTIPGTLDYNPGRLLTRAEAAKFLSLFAENILCRKTTKVYPQGFFKDLGLTDTGLQSYIILSYEHGIFNGDVGGMFRPNDVISKDELTAVLMRMVMNQFNEAEGQYRAQNYIKLLENNTSIPLNDVTRGNTAEVLYDLYRYNTYTLVSEVGYVLQ